ncbi:MAG: minor capsid protein [Clostridium sp.]|uniref:minor capsid protein n=1 Tax=Clostridium sp. TaxID=1506 RepID=UPI0029124660|nr:minor capsid protein [Clostridium sp.]MDU7339023.1 minor capsid protein [Clostridium sp.]
MASTNNHLIVKTPRGSVITNAYASGKNAGKVTAKIEWNPDFGAKKTQNFTAAQKHVDSEVLRLSTPFIPKRTSALIKSGELGTVVGSGEVNWIAPYARNQYYNTSKTRIYDPRRGAFWFERMKAVYKTQIVEGAKRIAGGGGK